MHANRVAFDDGLRIEHTNMYVFSCGETHAWRIIEMEHLRTSAHPRNKM